MGKRKKAREEALQLLYLMVITGFSADEGIEAFRKLQGSFKGDEEFTRAVVYGVTKHLEEIDELIRRFSKHWRIERMSVVDRSALRIGVFELIYREDIPPRVSINEAIELGKKFGDTESGAFINGILDAIYGHLLVEGIVPSEPEYSPDESEGYVSGHSHT